MHYVYSFNVWRTSHSPVKYLYIRVLETKYLCGSVIFSMRTFGGLETQWHTLALGGGASILMAVLRAVSMLVLMWSPVLQKVGCQAPCTLEDVVPLSDFNLTRVGCPYDLFFARLVLRSGTLPPSRTFFFCFLYFIFLKPDSTHYCRYCTTK